MRRPRTELARRAARQGAIDVEPDAIKDAVAQLSDRQRAIIYRSHYLRRTTAEIATELNTDDDAVKQELHHALHTLRMNVPGCRTGARHG